MYPDEVVDLRLEPVAILVGAVVAVVDAWITFRAKDISVAENLVDDDAAVAQVGVVILDKRHGVERGDTDEAGVIEVRHVEAAGVAAHRGEHESQRKIKRARSTLHAHRVEDPAVHQNPVAVKELADGEFSRHRFAVQKRPQKVGGQPLHIIDAISLHIQRAGQPVRGSDEIVEYVARRLCVDRA